MSLHLVEHARKRRLELKRLLDLVGANVRVPAIFKEARALMLAHEFDEGRWVRFPIFREALEVPEDGIDAGGAE